MHLEYQCKMCTKIDLDFITSLTGFAGTEDKCTECPAGTYLDFNTGNCGQCRPTKDKNGDLSYQLKTQNYMQYPDGYSSLTQGIYLPYNDNNNQYGFCEPLYDGEVVLHDTTAKVIKAEIIDVNGDTVLGDEGRAYISAD